MDARGYIEEGCPKKLGAKNSVIFRFWASEGFEFLLGAGYCGVHKSTHHGKRMLSEYLFVTLPTSGKWWDGLKPNCLGQVR